MDNTRTIDRFDEIKALFETRDRQAIAVENKEGREAVEMITKDTPTV